MPLGSPRPATSSLHARTAQDLHAVPRVLGLVELRHHGRDHAVHDAVGRFEHGHVEPRFAAGGGHLEADVAAADDDRAPPGAQLGAQPVDVRRRAQVVHAGQFGAGHRQQARLAAGGQQQLVVFDVRPVGDLHALRRAIEAHGREPQPQVDGVLGVVGGVADQQPIAHPACPARYFFDSGGR